MSRDSSLSRKIVVSVSPAKSLWRYHSQNSILSHILHRTLCESFCHIRTETNIWMLLHLVGTTQAYTLVEQVTLNICLEMSPVRHNFVNFFIILCFFFVISYCLECSMLRTALFWIITQWVEEIFYRPFETTCRSQLQGSTLEAGTERLSRKADKNYHCLPCYNP